MVTRSGRNPSRWGGLVLVVALLLALAAGAAHAQCVGDCNGDGEVTINELITGVNIALGSQPVSACPAFANDQGVVDIAQLIKGVNNALNGCPATPTVTTTTTAVPTVSATATSSPTATGIPTGTATATGVPTMPATATATVPPSATAPATQPPAATATATGLPTGTATATTPPTAADTPTPTPTATQAPSATITETPIPPGESIAGRAAVVATGLGGVQAMVGAIVSIITNDGSDLTFGLDDGVGGVADVDNCPLGGTTSQDCSGPNGGPLMISLGATNCIAAGPLGGEAEFNGDVTINANAGLLVQCGDPPFFFGGSLALDNLGVRFRDALGEPLLDVTADLGGPFTLTPTISACLVGSLNLTLTGTLTSVLGDGSGVSVLFQNTSVVIDQIQFNEDCVPIVYRLTFNGPATFTPMFADLAGGAPALVGGSAPSGSFAVTFAAFRIVQNATANPVTVTMTGNMTSDCFGGTLGLSTFTPVAVAAGQLCPASGAIDVTGGGTSARVTYDDGAVTVDPASGPPQDYPSCLDPALFVCEAS
jgi:hypothetical protein